MLSFDDIIITPQLTININLNSRNGVKLDRLFTFRHSSKSLLAIPIMSSNMSCITTQAFACVFSDLGGLPCLHKFYDEKSLVEFFNKNSSVFYTTGVRGEDLDKLFKVGQQTSLNYIHLDCPNGYIPAFYESLKKIRNVFKDSVIMAGNVCTKDAARRVIEEGADIVKIGIASGANCTTYKKTGIGIPQAQALLDTTSAVHKLGGFVCSDGGIKTPSDACKALVLGADFVMAGTFFGGVEENYGNPECTWQTGNFVSGHKHKDSQLVYGMASAKALELHYNMESGKNYRTVEGKEEWIPYKGKLQTVFDDLLGGIRSCCTFTDSPTIWDLKKVTFRVNK